jgi:hypothetical protein
MDMRAAIWTVLGFGVLPLWLAAGGADWLCHRRSGIERTSGPVESLLHIGLFLQIALPVLLGLWFEINALLLAVFAAAVLAHMATSWLDTAFSQPRRHIAPIEQQVHSWLEMLPLFGWVLIALLHLDAFSRPQWEFIARAAPVPTPWPVVVPALLAAGMALIIEELIRGLRQPRTMATDSGRDRP